MRLINCKVFCRKTATCVIWLTNGLNKFLDKILAPKPVVSTVPKIALLYLGKFSFQIRTMKNKLTYCNLLFVFQTKCKISDFFTFKDKIPLFLRSGNVYKFQCGGCNAFNYGKTKRHFKVKICEHFLHSLGKELKVMMICH